MGPALRSSALLLAVAIAVSTAGTDADELLDKARAKVLDSAHRLPRYTCVETVSRAQYQPPPGRPPSCTAMITRRHLGNVQGVLSVHDRLRLDVAVVDGGEMFSWAGARQFETRNVDKLVGGGASGSGDFGSFVQSVFGSAPESIRYQGLRDNFALFEYVVPLERSNYTYRSDAGGMPKKTAYRGSFSVDPSDGDLQQLVVETDEFEAGDQACSVAHVMDYQRVKIGSGDFLLPEVSTMKALYRNGAESVNETHYSDCREYVGESTIRFDDADPVAAPAATSKAGPRPLAPRTRLQIALTKPIDTDVAAAGDEVNGVATFGRETGRVHGRILRLAQFMLPLPRWIMAIRFDSIERGGVSQPLSLNPIDGNRTSPYRELPPDAGIFNFDAFGKVVLDQNFRSLWETR